MKETLLFLDLETTGLSPENGEILEVAVLVCDEKVNILERYQGVAKQSNSVYNLMDEYVYGMHESSFLLRELAFATKTLHDIELEIIELLSKHSDEKWTLVGNSIHFDRKWIEKHMKKLDARLQYRMIDVSSFDEMVKRCEPRNRYLKPSKPHRAMADIENTYKEYCHYRDILYEWEK